MAEETKEQPRLQHLKSIETSVQERMANENLYEFEALEGHENMQFEEKNATKYMATFPYPYMNGYLHLGKFVFHFCRVNQNNLTINLLE